MWNHATNEANVADTIPPGRRRTRSTTWLPPRVENSTIELTAILGVAHVTAPPPDDGTSSPPVWRVAPQSPVEIAEVIRWCSDRHLAVVAAGSGLRPHAPWRRPTVLISTHRMNQITHLDENSLTAHVQAGLTGVALEKHLMPRGLSLGDYPPTVLASTLGGIIAVRTPGKSSARHGFFEDAVLGVSAVLADGRTVHTRVAPRRSTGPDLARALCGSEGTLGFITSVVLRLHRRPESRFVAAFVLPSVEAAVSAVFLALREEAQPSGVRIYDRAEAAVHFGAIALAEGEALLVVGTAGPTDLAACDRDLFASAVVAEGGRATDVTFAERWWQRLHGGEATPSAPAPLPVLASPAKMRNVYRAIQDVARDLGVSPRAHITRFDADGAMLYVSLTAGDRTDAGDGGAAILEALATAAADAGGWPVATRPGRLEPYMQALRRSLDPKGILNPESFDEVLSLAANTSIARAIVVSEPSLDKPIAVTDPLQRDPRS